MFELQRWNIELHLLETILLSYLDRSGENVLKVDDMNIGH